MRLGIDYADLRSLHRRDKAARWVADITYGSPYRLCISPWAYPVSALATLVQVVACAKTYRRGIMPDYTSIDLETRSP